MTREEKIAAIQRLRALQAERQRRQEEPVTEEPDDDTSWLDELGAGVGTSILRTAVGAQELARDAGFPISSEEWQQQDVEALERRRQQSEDSGFGTAGRVVGDVAQLAVPGGGALRAARAAQLGRGATGAATFGTDVASSAGLGAVQAPEEGQTRQQAATQGAAGALLGGALGKVGEKVLRGARRTPEAESLLQKGVRLQPGQASEGGIPRAMDALARMTMFTRKGMEQLDQRALRDWNKSILNEVAPPGKEVSRIGVEGADELKGAFSEAYDEAWAGAGPISPGGQTELVGQIQRIAADYGDEANRFLRKIGNKLVDVQKEFTPAKLRSLDKEMRNSVENLSSGQRAFPELAQEIKGLRSTLRDSVGGDVRDKLIQVDQKWAPFLAVRKAATTRGARRNQQIFTPDDLANAAASVGGESRAFGSAAPLFQQTSEAVQTLGRKDPRFLTGVRQALAANVPSPTPLIEARRRAMLGETAPQRAVQSTVDPIIQALREGGVSGATTGGAYGGQ